MDPVGSHLPGKLNRLADYYSRVGALVSEPMPEEARGVKTRELTRSSAGRGYALPTAAVGPEVWASSLTTDDESAGECRETQKCDTQ